MAPRDINRWVLAHGGSAVIHVSLIALMAGTAAQWMAAHNSGRRVIQTTWISALQPSPEAVLEPVLEPVPIEAVRFEPRAASASATPRREAMPPSKQLVEPTASVKAAATLSADLPDAERAEPVERPPAAKPTPPPVPRRHAKPQPPMVSAIPAVLGDPTQPPRSAHNPPPQYPPAALSARQQGDVTLRVTIAATGLVADVRLHRSSGHQLLDQAAMDAVKRWRFEPALRDGHPVEWTAKLPIEFRLRR